MKKSEIVKKGYTKIAANYSNQRNLYPNKALLSKFIKYAPKKLDDFIGNKEKIEYIKQWILHYLNGKNKKPLLIWGPPGTGKTSLAYAIKEEFELDLVEMNASELRNKKRVERVLGGASLANSLFGKGKIIIIDDADILAA